MRLTNTRWSVKVADGSWVTLTASLIGDEIALASADAEVLRLPTPVPPALYSESQPMALQGTTLVLVARRVDSNTTLCNLACDGRDRDSNLTLEQMRARDARPAPDAAAVAAWLCLMSPLLIVVVLVKALANQVDSSTLPGIAVTAAVSVAVSFGAGWLGRRAIAAIPKSNPRRGLRAGAIAVGVFGLSYLVAALLVVALVRK
jgi:hypothetical protein